MDYILQDIDGNQYQIPLVNFRKQEDGLDIDIDIIERSYDAGGIKSGASRDRSSELTYVFDYWNDEITDYQSATNELIAWLRKAVLLINNTTQKYTNIELSKIDFKYEEGSEYNMAAGSVSFKQLTPYWLSMTEYQKKNAYPSTDILLEFTNNGAVETPPIITITAESDNVSKFSIQILETLQGISIQDLDFSQNGQMVYVIDCQTGQVTMSGLDRNNRIKSGTGFFNLKPGTNSVYIISNGNVTCNIAYRERNYI